MNRSLPALMISAVLLVACGPGSETLRALLDSGRASAGVDPAIDSPYLDTGAWVESVYACQRANGIEQPAPTFDRETYSELTYLTGTSALTDDEAAAQALINSLPFSARAASLQAKWDRKGLATYRCPDDGLLYGTVVLSDFIAAPSGRYIETVFSEQDIVIHDGIRYGTAPLLFDRSNDLLMDIYEPAGDTLVSRPTMVVIHGGGFRSGNRKKNADKALSYALRGYVAVAIEYRTCPGEFESDEAQFETAANAIDDGIEAIRFLHANAATYGIDTTRIGAVGTSAGGFIALGAALIDDQTPGGPLEAYPYQPAAVMSTGANLTAALESPGFRASISPVMMFRYEFDTVAGPEDESYEWPYSYRTCLEIHAKDATCDFFRLDGPGHVSGIGAAGAYAKWYLPWFYEKMDLANAN